MISSSNARLRRSIAAAMSGVLALGLAACDQQQKKPESFGQKFETAPQKSADAALPQQSANPDAPKSGVAVDIPNPGDSALESRVKTAISTEPGLKSVTVDVVAIDGVVTLNGTADTHATSDRAARIALNVDGVRSVKNELVVVQGS